MKKYSWTYRIVAGVLVLMLALSLSACSLFNKDFPVTIGDVKITKAPQRVAAFSACAASAVTALGYDSYLVAATSDYASKNKDAIADLGNVASPDMEALYQATPDIVVVPDVLSADMAKNFKLHDIQAVVIPTPMTYGEVAGYYSSIAKLFLGEKKGNDAATAYTDSVSGMMDELKSANAGVTKKALVYIEDGFVATGDSLLGEALNRVGIQNVAAAQTDYMMSIVDIAAANPDVIFCNKGLAETILKKEALKDVTAIKNGAVYEIDLADAIFAGAGFSGALQDMSTYLKK